MHFWNGCILFWNILHASSCNYSYTEQSPCYLLPTVVCIYKPFCAGFHFSHWYDAASQGNRIPTFRTNALPLSSGSTGPQDLLNLKTSGSDYPVMQRNIPQEGNRQIRPSFSRPISMALQTSMTLRKHSVIRPWREIGPFQGLCQHRAT